MSGQYPKISIVTPNYNKGQYLEETILSVIEQNYPNLEYIIIDGGSTDNSVEIIKKYEKYLAYWTSEKDNGMYEAIQKGFDKSSGEIMAWINSDDKYHLGAFSAVAEIFSTFKEIRWLTGAPTLWDKYGRCVVKESTLWSKYKMYMGYCLERGIYIQQESTFWRRSLWEQAGGQLNTSFKLAGDFELWLRFFRYAQLYTTEALLGGFRVYGTEQLSVAEYKRYLEEANLALRQEIENLPKKDKDRLKILRRYAAFLSFTSRINIGFLKKKYWDLFEFPPKVIYNFRHQKFELLSKVMLNA